MDYDLGSLFNLDHRELVSNTKQVVVLSRVLDPCEE